MKTKIFPRLALVASLLLPLASCHTRSISNSDYEPNRFGRPGDYRGELSELQVVGVAVDSTVTDADIAAALKSTDRARLTRSSKVLLIQSGADFPDAPMLDALSVRYSVAPFSGKPRARDEQNAASYAKSLRLAAARGGYDKIVCYWGVLESEQKSQVTKTVSWVPIVGYAIPDERQNMRIRLRAAIVDVASGRWSFVTPPPATSSDFSSIFSRRETDQNLVGKLKEAGYQSLAQTLTDHYTD